MSDFVSMCLDCGHVILSGPLAEHICGVIDHAIFTYASASELHRRIEEWRRTHPTPDGLPSARRGTSA